MIILKKNCAPSVLDQSKVSFSQHMPLFSDVPYYGHYLEGATNKVFEKDLDSEELWMVKQRNIWCVF